jgi:very-short-patch-repair endonuclease
MPKLNEIHVAIGRQSQVDGVDRRVAELAERQHGVVARRQLREMGVGARAIDHRVQRGRLHLVYRGVYAVGYASLTAEGRIMGAVLASGPGTVASHRAAGTAWGFWHSNRLDVTAARARRSRSGVVLHYRQLAPDEITAVREIPVTTVARTVFDLASVLSRSQLERALDEAEIQLLTDSCSVAEVLERHPRCHGAPLLRALLSDRGLGTMRIRSELERQFLKLIRRKRLPMPEMNVRLHVGGRWIECDFVWREARLLVELDGRTFHATPAAFERDRARDRALSVADWKVIRVTWRQLHEQPEHLAADLKTLLSGKNTA